MLLLILLALPGAGSAAPAFQARVLSIGDGDTLRVRRGEQRITIRLACIDAPETAQRPYGQQAREALQRRLPIGRTVAEVFSDTNINLALVEAGLAFAYRRYLGPCDAGAYLGAEDRARRQGLGVWGVPGGLTRPWDFRRGRGGSHARAQPLLRQGHSDLDANGVGEACESLH
ncbi:thermonuclease family protein [Synechococcus sp. CCY 9618]|uniref:thermonuclease family protein n=1 Tax=Synechococcus sp. CCY 9618 TaxID=2815602 RepID=UPI0020B1FD64|nr:thermonuclease family protein [Synechococcus sp. CCY 9618]